MVLLPSNRVFKSRMSRSPGESRTPFPIPKRCQKSRSSLITGRQSRVAEINEGHSRVAEIKGGFSSKDKGRMWQSRIDEVRM